jgi:hypothetical protein
MTIKAWIVLGNSVVTQLIQTINRVRKKRWVIVLEIGQVMANQTRMNLLGELQFLLYKSSKRGSPQ